jgi:WD40 repeat protein
MRSRIIGAIACALWFAACDGEIESPYQIPNVTHDIQMHTPWSELTGRIAFSRDNQIFIIDSHERTIRKFPDTPVESEVIYTPSRFSFSPDSRRLAAEWWSYADTTRETRIYDIRTGVVVNTLEGQCVEWLDNGDLMYMGNDGTIYRNGVEVGSINSVECPSFSRRGEFAIFTRQSVGPADRTQLLRIDFSSGALTEIVSNNGNNYNFAAALSPDDNNIVVQLETGSHAMEITIISVNGGNPRPITTFWPPHHYAAWSPDSRKIMFAVGDEVLQIVDVATQQSNLVIEGPGVRFGWGR